MSNEILIPIIESIKDENGRPRYCCIKQWLMCHRHVKTSKLAEAYGVCRSTIKNWRRRLKLGDLPCAQAPNCKLATAAIRFQKKEEAA